MNFSLVFKILGRTLLLEGFALLLPTGVALLYGEDIRPFLYTILILLVVGGLLSLLRASRQFFAREGFFTVALTWVMFGVFGALPFWFSGQFSSYIDCLFETISGFTTTGASVLTAVEGLPMGLLFWRSFTHWLGGMGVLVLTAALLPSLGVEGTYLIQAESPGPVPSKLVPRSSTSSKILYGIYLAMTVAETLLLRLVGLPWFDAVVSAFGTAGTGGFSVRNLSIGAYDNPAAEVIITIFMLLFSVNFTIYFLLLSRKWRQALASDELRFFLLIVAGSIVFITLNIVPQYGGFTWESLRHAAFQVASIISTTGYATANFDLWPEFSRFLIFVLMLVGACAGSTGGGMKCSRVLVLFKSIRREIRQIIHPRSVNLVRLDGQTLEEGTVRSICVFCGAYVMVTLMASLIVGLDNFTFDTTITAVVSCVSNIGPGLEMVGPMGNFSAFSDLSKLVLSLCMVIGRLEIFPILVLFSKNAWKRS